MKNIILIFKTIVLILLYISTPYIPVFAETNYARIESTTQIYKTSEINDSIDNIFCLAEESYFVQIISEHKDFFKVYYNNIYGYIKKSDVREVSSIPYTPYPNNIKITIGSNCNLRSSPTTKSSTNNIISTVYTGTSDIVFIGRAIGEEAIDFGGSTWYYVSCNGNYGYIYNNYVKSITPIYKNNDDYTYKEGNIAKIENPITHTPSLIIIIVLLIPLVILLVILYLPKPTKSKRKLQKPPKIIDRY